MKNKIIVISILMILFTLCISNYSKAYREGNKYENIHDQNSIDNRNPIYDPNSPLFDYDKYMEYLDQKFEEEHGYSRAFCSEGRRVDAIYRTMYRNPNAWLDAKLPAMTNGWSYGWTYVSCNNAHNGIGPSMVWSTGGSCCGHIGEPGGVQEPYTLRIKVFDVMGDEFINDTDSEEVKEEKRRKAGLAFACLYSWKNNECVPKSKINDVPQGYDLGKWILEYVAAHPMKGRDAVINWLATEPGLPSSQIHDYQVYRYNINYGTMNIGGTNYNAQSYIASKSNTLKCNEEKMEQDKQNGMKPTSKWKTINGKNYTIIGPYRIDIKGKVEADMQYINSQDQSIKIDAVGYTTSETDSIREFTNNTVVSSNYNQLYLVFEGHRNIKKVESIKVKQEVATIRARMVFAESVEWGGQHLNVRCGREEMTSVERELPIPATTTIKVTKIDSDNGVELKNAQFVLKNLTTGQYAVGGKNTIEYNTWTTNIAYATTYQSGDIISLEKTAVYQFYEVQAENEYYKACSKTESGKIAVGAKTTIYNGNYYETTLTNQPVGYVILSKTDETTGKELNNTRFVIKRIDTGQYASGGTATNKTATWVNNINQATWYAPKQKICFEQKINYQVYEVQRENESYAYCSMGSPLVVGGTQTVAYRTTTTVKLTNKKAYVKISGYVWEDMSLTGKESNYDNLYNRSVAPDRLVANVKVILRDSKGNILNTRANGQAVATTNLYGAYTFKEIEIDKLPGAYIEFTYNGMAYKAVTLNANRTNGSKATEGSRRDTFNNKFQVITNNRATGSAGTLGVSYTQRNGISTLSYEGGSYGYSGQKYPVAGVAGKYQITANTTTAGLLGQTAITINDINTKDITEIPNINLGIVEREQPDISLVKDIEKIQVSASGTSYTYKYADRFTQSLDYNMSPQVKFAGKYGTMTYTRALYASDVYYNQMAGRNPNNDLKIKVRYKIGMRNTSSTLVATINEIDDYYSSDYYMDKAKIKITKQDNSNLTVNTPVDLKNGYNKLKINNMNLQLQPNSVGYIFVELEIKQDQIAKIIQSNRTAKLNNIAEISSYSIKDRAGKTYAGIDQDSNPGNIVIGQTNTYEDDTDKAPGLELVLQEPRKIDGIVFLDGTTNDLQIGQKREGDGEYKNGESGIKGVEVKLVEAGTNKIAKKYNESTKRWEEAKLTTKDDGRIEFSGLIPGNYELLYEWGGKTTTCKGQVINVQNYKGTIYKEGETRWNKGEYWYKYNMDKRYSDAQDDYNKRKQIDAQTSTITNGIQEVVNKQEGKINGTDLITKMESKTPRLKVNLEWDNKNEMNYKDELKDGKVQLDKNGYLIKADAYKNHIKNVDFGISERPRQVLKLDKAIKSAKVITPNGNIIANATIVTGANGKKVLQDQSKNTAYMPNKDGTDGQVKFEIDEEMIQGAKLEVEYSLSVSNISEIDYTNKEYYLYGKEPTNKKELVYLKASNIIDYLNDNMMADDENIENVGKLIREVNDKSKLFTDGLLSNQLKTFVNGTSKILLIDKAQALKNELRPAKGQDSMEIGEVTVKGSKLLAKNEETTLENNAEIIKVEKSGGATLVMTTPGNYIPSQSQSEYDDDKSEMVYILPPTGLRFDYIAYTILAISSLGILICGIILIKKYVMRH